MNHGESVVDAHRNLSEEMDAHVESELRFNTIQEAYNIWQQCKSIHGVDTYVEGDSFVVAEEDVFCIRLQHVRLESD